MGTLEKEKDMKNYIVKTDSPTGSQLIQLAASNIQDVQSQIKAMTKANGESSVRYSIQEQPSALDPGSTAALLEASGGMLLSIVVLVICVHYINRHFKDLRRGGK
jgi:hypothetical protein